MSERAPPARSLRAAIADVLAIAVPQGHVLACRALVRDWRGGRLAHDFAGYLPDAPARPAKPQLLRPGAMPRRGRGSTAGRIALLHALAHIEYVAIALALDMAGRFGADFPRAFVDDWLGVAADEAMHFALLDRRLRSLGSHYGAMPAHDGLWQSARATAGDALARLAIVPMVLEARGLDVTPPTIERFAAAGDMASARILTRIYQDEIRHVAVGTKWFNWGCARAGLVPESHWQMLVNQGFRGSLKPPFNDSARSTAGLTQLYYAPLATPDATLHTQGSAGSMPETA
ncbi:MAG: ferritin-like domain-containing protein [Sphingomonadaceae bacterium]|nr:ferritin-like domain-containing protein [Sphingomonadaceae bacterium]